MSPFTPSEIMLYVAAILATSVVMSLAYISLPYTPRRVERVLKAWLSPATLVAYLCTIIAATLAAIGQ